jgi:hypothetical protein
VCLTALSKVIVSTLEGCGHKLCFICTRTLLLTTKKCPLCRAKFNTHNFDVGVTALEWLCQYATDAEQKNFFYTIEEKDRVPLPHYLMYLKNEYMPLLDRCVPLFRNGTDRAAYNLAFATYCSGISLRPFNYVFKGKTTANIRTEVVIPYSTRTDSSRADTIVYCRNGSITDAIDSALFDDVLITARDVCRKTRYRVRILGLHTCFSTCETACGCTINAMQYYVTTRLSQNWSYEQIIEVTGSCGLSRTLKSLETEPPNKDYAAQYNKLYVGNVCYCRGYDIVCNSVFFMLVRFLDKLPKKRASLSEIYTKFSTNMNKTICAACTTDRFGRYVRWNSTDGELGFVDERTAFVELCVDDIKSIPIAIGAYPFVPLPPQDIPTIDTSHLTPPAKTRK